MQTPVISLTAGFSAKHQCGTALPKHPR